MKLDRIPQEVLKQLGELKGVSRYRGKLVMGYHGAAFLNGNPQIGNGMVKYVQAINLFKCLALCADA